MSASLPKLLSFRGVTNSIVVKQPLNFRATEPAERPFKPWHRDAFIDASHRIARLGYCEWDYINGRILSCSPYYAEIFGMTIPEVIESQSSWEKVLQQLHPDDREHYARSYEGQLGAGTHEHDPAWPPYRGAVARQHTG